MVTLAVFRRRERGSVLPNFVAILCFFVARVMLSKYNLLSLIHLYMNIHTIRKIYGRFSERWTINMILRSS